MIRKRPLCFFALAVTALLLILPSGIWMKDFILEGRIPAEGLTGKVIRMEPRTDGQAVYLKHSYLSDKGIILLYFDAEQSFSIGNTIRIEPPYRIWEPEAPANPGQFDARLYYQTQNIVLFGSASKASLVDGRIFWPGELLGRLRKNLSLRCSRLFGTESGVLRAVLLGDKTALTPETKDIYQKSGMSHVLAISGLHISIVGMSLYRFLRKRTCSYMVSGSVGMAFVLLYGAMTGMSISTARAVSMFGLAVTADLLGRSYDMLTALAVSGLLLLLEQPLYVRSASFLLSFGAVLGVGLLYPAVRSLIPQGGRWADALLVSLSIQLTAIPLIQWFYYEFPLYSVCLNLLVIPLMGLLMLCGIGALGMSFLSWQAAGIPAFVCSLILRVYERLGQETLRLPWSVIICGKPKLWQILVYYGGLSAFVFWRSYVKEKEKWELCLRTAEERDRKEEKQEEAQKEKKGQKEKEHKKDRERKSLLRERYIGTGVIVLLCIFLQLRFDRGFAFTMLDVGQGDGLFLRTKDGTTCLIDGGSSDVKEVGRYRILPFLKQQGTKKLDYVIITHTDSDHISGIRELLEQAGEPGGIRTGTLLLSEQSAEEEAGKELCELAEKGGTAVKTIGAGALLEDKSTRISCLHPARGSSYEDKNAGSLVLRLTYGDFSMLLTGDLEETGERSILENQEELNCSILKAGHHGSRFSTTEEWLAAVRPALALISCGRDNSYGHPHAETLERLREAGSQILLTAGQGAVTVHSDGQRFWVTGFH